MKEKKYNYVYETTNLINGMKYRGVHSSNLIPSKDNYMGSNKLLTEDIAKYGISNFKREVLKFFDNREEAFIYESIIVDGKWIARDDTYNLARGGRWGIDALNKVTVKDKNGKFFQISINDERYKSGELKHVACGMIVVKDKDGNTSSVSTNDPRYLSGELVPASTGWTIARDVNENIIRVLSEHFNKSDKLRGINCNKRTVKDKFGNTLMLNKDDEKLKTDEYCAINLGLAVVKDENGNTMSVSVNDERYTNGVLVGAMKGTVTVKDNEGNHFRVDKNDQRYLSGELVGTTKGLATYKDKDGNTYRVSKDDPRYILGELVGIQSGKKYMHNIHTHEQKYVNKEDIDEYINSGNWKFGRIKAIKRKI